MLKIEGDILEYFFNVVSKVGKYEVSFGEKGALISPRAEEEYYKPQIIVKDLENLKYSLEEFVRALNNFYEGTSVIKPYHHLSYFLSNLFFNMTVSDALDLAKFIDKRTYFLTNTQFEEYEEPQVVFENDNERYYAHRVLEEPGLETPYIIEFL